MIIGTFDTNLIPSTSIRDYFEEIMANYVDGHNRSAIVLLYSAVVTDIMQKLIDLRDGFNDASATSILEMIQSKKMSNPKDPSWENDVVDEVLEKNIVDSVTVMKIKQLQQQRHLSAHPALNEDYELFNPSRETVYDYISFMYENLLTRPAPFLGNVIDKMTEDLSNYACCLETNPQSIEKRILEKYFNRCREKDFNRIYKAYWKFVFKKSDDVRLVQDKPLNFFVLSCLTKFGKNLVSNILQEGKVFDITSIEDDFLLYLTIFFEQYDDLYVFIPEAWKTIVKNFAWSNPNCRLKAWYVTSLKQHLDTLLEEGFIPYEVDIEEESYHKFYDKCRLWGLENDALSLFIRMIGKAGSFVAVDHVFDRAIRPFLSLMTEDNINTLLNEMNGNDQVYWKNRNKDYMVTTVKKEYEQKFQKQLNIQAYSNLV